MSSQYPYDNSPQNPGYTGNQGQNPPYPPGYGQQYPPTQYDQPGSYPPPPQYTQPDAYTNPPQYAPSDPYSAPPPYQQSAMYPPPVAGYSAYAAPATQSDRGMGFAIAGLVLGIIGIVSSWFPICGLPVPIVGVILSALGRNRSITPSYRIMAIVGLVLSIVALAIGLLINVLIFAHPR